MRTFVLLVITKPPSELTSNSDIFPPQRMMKNACVSSWPRT